MDQTKRPRTRLRLRRAIDCSLGISGLALVVGALVFTPGGLLDKADHVGYAVCHQIPVRSFFLGNRQLPLCARCSGQYLGALAGMVLLLLKGRGRAGLLPPPRIVILLVGFIAIWGIDGLNSYLTLFPGAPHLYEPHNLLRVTTGSLQGVALIVLVLPFFNVSLWQETEEQRSLASLQEVALLLALVAGIVILVGSESAVLLYPLALLSIAGTLLMLTLVNTMLVAILLRREGSAQQWSDIWPLLAAGLGFALLEVLVLNLARASLTSALGLPF